MKIALLHIDLCNGTEEKNTRKIRHAVDTAVRHGAKWVVTPETALQGYFFYDKDNQQQIPVQPNDSAGSLCRVAAEYGITLFLSCAERDADTGHCHNSCLVVGPEGQIMGRHRKMHTHGVGAEAWITTGTIAEPVCCGDISAGILICADVWYTEHSKTLKEKGARIILAPAAWPPGPCGPADSWEKSSLASGIPVCICNQTGMHPVMDLTGAESAVLFNGRRCHAYSGKQSVVLIFDWDFETERLLSGAFEVIPLEPQNRFLR